MVEFFGEWVSQFWFILEKSGIWLLVGFSLAGAVHALVPAGLIQKQLAGKGIGPIVRASLLGIPLPLCSCSVIPVAAGLRRAGAGRGATAAFAISTPQTGEESIPVTWALFGPVFAISRPIIAVITALIAGLCVERFGGEHEATGKATKCGCSGKTGPADGAPGSLEKGCCGGETGGTPIPQEKAQETKSCCSSEAVVGDGLMTKLGSAFYHGFVTMPLDLAPWLGLGLSLAALVSAAVPHGWIEQNVGTGIVPMLLMLAVGIPLYICATSSTPLAFTLVAAGLSPGAALVLLLVGPATNVATISWSIKDLGGRATVISMGVVIVVALGFGLLFDAFFSEMLVLADVSAAHQHGHGGMIGGLAEGGAVSLVLLLGVALIVRVWRRIEPMVSATHE